MPRTTRSGKTWLLGGTIAGIFALAGAMWFGPDPSEQKAGVARQLIGVLMVIAGALGNGGQRREDEHTPYSPVPGRDVPPTTEDSPLP